MTDERKAELLEKLIQEALNQDDEIDEEIFLGSLAGGLAYVGMTEDEAKELGLEEWV